MLKIENVSFCDFSNPFQIAFPGPNGMSASISQNGEICRVHNKMECIQCNQGYRLNSLKECTKSVCNCSNGIAGTNCATQNGNECIECDLGYSFCASTLTCHKKFTLEWWQCNLFKTEQKKTRRIWWQF